MDYPLEYIKNNSMQRDEAKYVANKFVERMTWKSDEIVLDLGCGPGDVSFDILYPLVKNKVKQLVGVDKSNETIKYAKKTYGCSFMDFRVLDIENANDCNSYAHSFDKIFSFLCFHWIRNTHDALVNIKSMLKSSGQIYMHYLTIAPAVEFYKKLNSEWQLRINETLQANRHVPSKEEIITMFEKVGLRIISIEMNQNKYTFPDFTSLLGMFKCVDEMFQILPPEEHERYSLHVRDILPGTDIIDVCPTTGKTTMTYYTATVHAVND